MADGKEPEKNREKIITEKQKKKRKSKIQKKSIAFNYKT